MTSRLTGCCWINWLFLKSEEVNYGRIRVLRKSKKTFEACMRRGEWRNIEMISCTPSREQHNVCIMYQNCWISLCELSINFSHCLQTNDVEETHGVFLCWFSYDSKNDRIMNPKLLLNFLLSTAFLSLFPVFDYNFYLISRQLHSLYLFQQKGRVVPFLLTHVAEEEGLMIIFQLFFWLVLKVELHSGKNSGENLKLNFYIFLKLSISSFSRAIDVLRMTLK